MNPPVHAAVRPLISLWQQLNHPQLAARLWLGKYCVLVAWAGLIAAVVFPPHGSGIAVCWIQGATGVPCPGCGITRSLSCAVRGMFLESWNYHPFGFFLLALFLFTTAQSLLPKDVRRQIARFMDARATAFNGAYLVFVTAFVGYGVARAVGHVAAHW